MRINFHWLRECDICLAPRPKTHTNIHIQTYIDYGNLSGNIWKLSVKFVTGPIGPLYDFDINIIFMFNLHHMPLPIGKSSHLCYHFANEINTCSIHSKFMFL